VKRAQLKAADELAPSPLNGLGILDPKSDMARVRRLQQLMASTVWYEDLKPMLEKSRESVIARLRDRSAKRKGDEPDDFLWGRLDQLDRFLSWPELSVKQSFVDLAKTLDFEDDGL